MGYLGWLRREKGTNELVAAFLRLASRFDDLYLLLVGDLEGDRDPLEPQTLDLIRNHQRIRHVRWTSHPERFLASMDVFAFPSWREGFGSVLLEAQAMGLPIVASDIAGVRDAVRFGESALPCNPGDDASIADALETLLGRPEMRARMGALGHIRAAKSFNKLRIEDLWVELAVSVARNRRRPALPPLRRGPGEFGTGRSAAPVKCTGPSPVSWDKVPTALYEPH